jgi:hypothetical protein
MATNVSVGEGAGFGVGLVKRTNSVTASGWDSLAAEISPTALTVMESAGCFAVTCASSAAGVLPGSGMVHLLIEWQLSVVNVACWPSVRVYSETVTLTLSVRRRPSVTHTCTVSGAGCPAVGALAGRAMLRHKLVFAVAVVVGVAVALGFLVGVGLALAVGFALMTSPSNEALGVSVGEAVAVVDIDGDGEGDGDGDVVGEESVGVGDGRTGMVRRGLGLGLGLALALGLGLGEAVALAVADPPRVARTSGWHWKLTVGSVVVPVLVPVPLPLNACACTAPETPTTTSTPRLTAIARVRTKPSVLTHRMRAVTYQQRVVATGFYTTNLYPTERGLSLMVVVDYLNNVGRPEAEITHTSSNRPFLAWARKSRHSAYVRARVASGATELRTLTTSSWTAISTHAPLSHRLCHIGSDAAESCLTTPPSPGCRTSYISEKSMIIPPLSMCVTSYVAYG